MASFTPMYVACILFGGSLIGLFAGLMVTSKLEGSHQNASPQSPLEYVASQSTSSQAISRVDNGMSRYCHSIFLNQEMNNRKGWRLLESCVDFVSNYMNNGNYKDDIWVGVQTAKEYAKDIKVIGDGFDAWILDIDDTCLSTLPYYRNQEYGAKKFDKEDYDKWINTGAAPPLPTLSLFNQLVRDKFSVFFITGRTEDQKNITELNLKYAGFYGWKKIILKHTNDLHLDGKGYKAKYRNLLVQQGFRIWGSMGDQWTDITGENAGNVFFKIPNPMYCVP